MHCMPCSPELPQQIKPTAQINVYTILFSYSSATQMRRLINLLISSLHPVIISKRWGEENLPLVMQLSCQLITAI